MRERQENSFDSLTYYDIYFEEKFEKSMVRSRYIDRRMACFQSTGTHFLETRDNEQK